MITLPQTPLLTVDAVIFNGNSVLLIKRANEPFKDCYALPGGFVDIGETVEKACIREAMEETNLVVSELLLIGVYSDPGRDSRRHTATVAFLCKADPSTLKAGDDAKHAEFVEDLDKIEIAFDHRKIIEDARGLRSRTNPNG